MPAGSTLELQPPPETPAAMSGERSCKRDRKEGRKGLNQMDQSTTTRQTLVMDGDGNGDGCLGGGMAALLRWAAEMGISDMPPPSSPSPPAPDTHSTCLGGSLLVSFFPDAGGRGLAAARELRKGELILGVPRSALLTTENVLSRDENLAACLEGHRSRLSADQILTVCLLYEVGKGKASHWYPYLVQLPHSYDTLANFSTFEIQAMQVEDSIWVSERAVNTAKARWKECLHLLEKLNLKPQLITFRAWLWASATLSSRTLHIPWDNAGCLCPVGDLFNYAAPEEVSQEDFESEPTQSSVTPLQQCKHNSEDLSLRNAGHPDSWRLTDGGYEQSMSSYCFYARRAYQKGEQVLLGYGTYTNLDILEHYGFMLRDNPNDKAFIKLDAEICALSSWPGDSLYIQPDGRPSFALNCVLRLWATPKSLRRMVAHRIYSGLVVSKENELLLLKWLSNHCNNILGGMSSTIADDKLLQETIDSMLDHHLCPESPRLASCWFDVQHFFQAHGLHLEDPKLSQLPAKTRISLNRWKLAVQWRLGYKKILLNCVSYCENMVLKL